MEAPAGEQAAAPPVHFALECKRQWAERILNGEKSLECRRYPPPEELAGHKVWLLAAGGEEGVPGFGDSIPASAPGGELVGWVLFDGAVEWRTAEAFNADAAQHCVPPNSPYAFPAGGGDTGPVYGWRVAASCRLPQPLPVPAMQRLVRSVYQAVS